MTRGILRHADRDAIFHDSVRTFYTLAEVEEERRNARELQHAGRNRRLATHPEHPVHPTLHLVGPEEEENDEHDWTQHGLGDPDDWEQAQDALHIVHGAMGEYPTHPESPDLGQMKPQDGTLGTHGAKVHTHPGGEQWLVKNSPAKKNGQPFDAPFLAHGDVGANAITQASGVATPPTFLTQNKAANNVPASMQLMYPGAKDAYPGKAFNPESVPDNDLLTIQKHHALDWLLGNHDSHGGQFIRDKNNQLIGIDKGQAFKHVNQDRLHWNYHPNETYGEEEPVYNTLYRNFAKGGREVFDPRQGELGQFIQNLQNLPDNEVQDALRPYAEEAAKHGMLAKNWEGYESHSPQKFAPNDPDAFLNHITERKNNLTNDFGDLYDRAMAHRMTGTKIARRLIAMPPPDPTELKPVSYKGDTGTHGAEVHGDPQGQWLIKKPPQGLEFMVPLDLATSQLQRKSGLEAPETYAVPHQGGLAAAHKMYPNASSPWDQRQGKKPPRLHQLNPQDLETVQKHQAMDWLVGNHDAHDGNWLRTQDGKLVGIDKGQSLKYFGRDRLDWNFHPNHYARPPIYNQLWKDHIDGMGEMQDPRQGPVGDYIKNLQNMPDDELRGMFHPYATAAAGVRQLGTGGPHDPARKLSPPSTMMPNNVNSFLDALVARKHSLHKDMGDFYDRANAERAKKMGFSHPTGGPDPFGNAVHQSAYRFSLDMNNIIPNLQNALSPKPTPANPNPPTPAIPKSPSASGNLAPTLPKPADSTTPATASGSGWGGLGIDTGTHGYPAPPKVPGTSNPLLAPGFNGIPFQRPMAPIAPGGGAPSAGGGATPSTPGTPGGGSSTPVNYSPNAGVDQWQTQIEEGLRRNGLPTTPDYINRVKKQMQTESGGNPKAINNSDSNAVAGHPSQGLMQTIPGTFQQYHLPGDSGDIYDPQANIDSAIGYGKSRYGPSLMDSSGNGIGSGHGY